MGRYLRRLCQYQGMKIVETHACFDYIYMLVKIPTKLVISKFIDI